MTACTAIRLVLVITQLSSLGEMGALAQSAQPLRIEFRPGSYTALVKESLEGRQQMEYITEIRKGKLVTLELVSGRPHELKVRLRDPHNRDSPLSKAGSRRWTATVAESGDYEIWVVRVRNTNGKSSYKLRITIR